MSAEIVAAVAEQVPPSVMRASPVRIALPSAPAPTSKVLERIYYPSSDDVSRAALALMGAEQPR
jgi:pyruvate dehydrogenase E1 component beta subunit